MKKIGFDFPNEARTTILATIEEWYQAHLAQLLDRPLVPINRSNFGQYAMAVNYTTSVLEEAKAVNNVAIYNIDHMAQVSFTGADAEKLLDRTLPANIKEMKIGQCKYTLLLHPNGCVADDMIVMKMAANHFILVINAGHDITDTGLDHGVETNFRADADIIMEQLLTNEDVSVCDISDQYAKIDIQGRLSFKLIKELYGEAALKNRHKPDKNMGFFTFNEFEFGGETYLISRTGYTNRWGFELYVPATVAAAQFKLIISKALEFDGLLVGLGGRDENRLSAGAFGLPLNGQEYTPATTAYNTPLFKAAVDMNKACFTGQAALKKEIASNDDRMVVVISEGIASGRTVYRDGQRLGIITSSINSPNVCLEKREFIGSTRKNVAGADGVAAIGIALLNINPYEKDVDAQEILADENGAIRIKVELYKEKNGAIKGKPLLGYISADGVNPATAARPLKHIAKL